MEQMHSRRRIKIFLQVVTRRYKHKSQSILLLLLDTIRIEFFLAKRISSIGPMEEQFEVGTNRSLIKALISAVTVTGSKLSFDMM